MDKFDPGQHLLLRDVAHKARLTPEEYPDFEARLRQEGVTPFEVEIPDWPPAPKSKLFLIFGDDPWEGEYWTGAQPALSQSDYQGRRTAVKLSRELAGQLHPTWTVAKLVRSSSPRSISSCSSNADSHPLSQPDRHPSAARRGRQRPRRSHYPANRTERPAEAPGRGPRRVLTASEPCPHAT